MSTIAVFIALGGAAAFAATELPANSVGTKQLKKDAVTATKIKEGAVGPTELALGAVGQGQLANGGVSGQKLASGAVSTDKLTDSGVTTAKLANGSVTADKLAPGAVPPGGGMQIVHRTLGTAILEFPPTTDHLQPVAYPLENATYTQPAGEDDLYVASIQVHMPASCTFTRGVEARLFIDAGTDSATSTTLGRAAVGETEHAGDETLTAQFSPTGEFGHGMANAAPATPTTHTFSLQLDDSVCAARGGTPTHITATGAQIDVIGIR